MSAWKKKTSIRGLFFILLACSWSAFCQTGPSKAAIASAHPLATEAGFETLAAGGNAFDAAVTVSAVLAVVEPYSSGLGGGGFWLLHRASDGFEIMVDGRETAPIAAHQDLYLNESGEVKPGLSINGPLAAGIPGEPAALAHIAQHYGKLPLATSLAPAIRLAREGFAVDPIYRRMAEWRQAALRESPAVRDTFLLPNEAVVPPLQWMVKQPDLADTLELLAKQGREGFYAGKLAARLVQGVRDAGGIWTLEDLQGYHVVERAPVKGRYRDLEITSAAPPSSGGIVLLTALNILQNFDLKNQPEPLHTHLMVEAMRRAYRDRAEYLGDPDFVEIPAQRLIHPYYAAGLARDIRLDQATRSLGTQAQVPEGQDTTHFSILDNEGNRVAATLSINYPFGSGFMPPGTGVLLNDEMDDFSARPGTPNVYGLVGGSANAIEPGKRMLSSMTPTFVESTDEIAILGTPGGSRIISMVLLGVLRLEEGMSAEQWVAAPRFHHQYLPDQIEFEPGALSKAMQQGLQNMGHSLKPLEQTYGNMQAVIWNRSSGDIQAVSDTRGIGKAIIR